MFVQKSSKMWTILVIIFISALPPSLANFTNDLSQGQTTTRVRRQYYVCPPGFKRISSHCYYFSTNMATWHDAHHDCRDKHSNLAIISTSSEDMKLRRQLNEPSVTPLDWWIGGIYNWEQMQWTWGISGKKLEYRGFSRMKPQDKDSLKWHCIIMDPNMKYKWSARSCVHGKHYICQKRVLRVGDKGLRKLRRKYKVDENNQLNEVPIPYYERIQPNTGRKHENRKLQANEIWQSNKINAYAHRNNTLTRLGKKRERKHRKGKGRKNRRNRNRLLQQNNGTYVRDYAERRERNRNKRNKSKESKEFNSEENSVNSFRNDREESRRKNDIIRNKAENSMEDITQKTTYLFNTLSPLHPRVIIEEHDFKD